MFRVALGFIFYFESQLAKMQSLEQVMGSLKTKLSLLVRLCSKLYIYVYIQQKLRRFCAVVGGLEIKKNAHPQTINAATATGAMHTHGYHPKQTPDS